MQQPPYIYVMEKSGDEEDNKAIQLLINDLLFVKYIPKKTYLLIHTLKGTFYTTRSFFELELILEQFDVLRLHTDVLVSMPKIEAFDDDFGIAYFERYPNDESIKVFVTRAAFKRVERYFDYKTANATNKELKKKKLWSYNKPNY